MTEVAVFNTTRRHRVRRGVVERYVQRVMGGRRARVSVVFVNSPASRVINRTYLQHDYVTDVVTFGLEKRPVLEGEIYVNLDRARQQAREYGVSMANEVARLVIHGCLHLLGYDDRTATERAAMKRIEDRHVAYWFPATQRGTKERT